MEDIAPGLLEKIQKDFRARIAANPKVRALETAIRGGTAGYADAEKYAELIGEALSQAFGNFLTAEALPDGKLYYNIAKRILDPMLKEDHEIVAQAAAMVQQSLNKQAGIGLKAQTAPVNQDRIDGIVYKVSNAEHIEDVVWVLEEPIKNFSISIVTDTLEKNVNFQGKAGLSPRIIRRTNGKCCKWCSDLAGTYDYPIDGREVYQRHEYCRCTVEYDPGEGKRQNVHTKRWTEQGESDIIEERKQTNLRSSVFKPAEYQKTISNHVSVNHEKVLEAAKAGKYHGHGGVYREANQKTMAQLRKSIVSRTAQVERHADKIKNPESYIETWNEKSQSEKAGIIRKWQKDMKRNAEQAEIELAVFEERFGS